MTLPINILQSLISKGRHTLSYLNADRAVYKQCRKVMDECGEYEAEKDYHNCYVETCKLLAKAEATQKALKRELGLHTHLQRCRKSQQRVAKDAAIQAGEVV